MKITIPAGIIAGLFAVAGFSAQAQDSAALAKPDPEMKIYRATPTKINDLIHTKLDVRFDYEKRFMYGKEWVTLKPHFYPTDSLRLDAKGMDIKTVAIIKNGAEHLLKYTYDSLSLNIHLDKTYSNSERYTIYLAYTSKPDQLKSAGSAAINDAKGLYFINPDSTEKGKPVQIWTQGETESNSAWFPTIDKPDQKTTDEISMTVPAKYVTLSNGRLASQKRNTDGTRTDTWVMDLPHSPYLFMMAVGNFKVYHDKWRNKPVDYYLEPAYAPYAKEIFGFTPEVMEFYSKTLGIDYPWNKYAQIVVRDYVSGAMENTTATLHGEQVQLTHREMIDGHGESEVDIVHELFHQWFGDYVTTESWSNLTVNESFADFSEMLWLEHKYGKDAGDAHSYEALQQYLQDPANSTKDLVRFHYDDREDMFDVVTYQKGGRILNMLRNYLGDAAFFKGLNIYLRTNAFKNTEAQHLRLALEEASGRDLNWFFNEWYYNAGHPVLKIDYKWDAPSKTEFVYLQQTQEGNPFVLPMAVDIYSNGKKDRHEIWMRQKADTLSFHTPNQPELVNVDGDKVLLGVKIDNKTAEQFKYQYAHAPLYLDRYEAIEAASPHQDIKVNRDIVLAALKDKYYGLRIMAIKALNFKNDEVRNTAVPSLINIAQTDQNTLVRAAALNMLAGLKAQTNQALFRQSLTSQSYSVQAAALNGIYQLDADEAFKTAKGLEKDSRGVLSQKIISIYAEKGGDAEWPFVYNSYRNLGLQGKGEMLKDFAIMTGRVSNPQYTQQGISQMKEIGIRFKVYGALPAVVNMLTQIKAAKAQAGDQASAAFADKTIGELNAVK